MPRATVILHADVDAFFASVAQRDDPQLRGKPVVVGGGIVMAASYEARAFGIRGAMGGAKARSLCPHLVVAEPSWPAYVAAGAAVFEIFERTGAVVEKLGIEEAFLDISALARSTAAARELGARLRAEVRAQTGLPITVGVGRTKIVAKMASRAAKPDGLLVVAPAQEDAFLRPIAVDELWGIGPKTARRLRARGLRTVGAVAQLSAAELMEILGTGSGRHVHALVNNVDRSRVEPNRPRRSFGAQRAMPRARGTPPVPDELDASLVRLTERVVRRMRDAGHTGRTVLLRLRFDDFSRVARAHTLAEATAAPEPILAAARTLLAAAMPVIERGGCTLVGLTVGNLCDVSGGEQLELALETARDAP